MAIWKFGNPPLVRPVEDVGKLLLGQWLAKFYKRTSDPLEAEQAVVRPLIGTVFFAWCFLFEDETWNIELLRATEVFFYATALLVLSHIRFVGGVSEWRRFIATIFDMVTILGCVASANEHLLVGLLAASQFVVIGNGFRYGADHLSRSFLVAIAVMACLYAFREWRDDPLTWSSIFLLLIVPLYALKFLKERNAMETDIVRRNELLDKKAGELARTNDQLDRALATKHRLLSNVSHELNSPLFALLHVVDRIRNAGSVVEASDLEVLQTSGQLLSDQVSNLLQLSDAREDSAQLPFEIFDLFEAIRGIAKALEVQAWKKGIMMKLAIPTNRDGLVAGHGSAIRQIAMNLIKNAVKFTDYGQVEVELVEDGDNQHTRRFALCVKDTGIGIPSEHLPHIWEPFYQADQGAGRSRGGSGLGLAIARDLADRIGARLTAESSGTGSLFKFEFSTDKVSDQDRICSLTQAKEFLRTDPSLRILVADDDEVVLEMIATDLRQAGHDVVACGEGTSALSSIRTLRDLDLVILDRHMPGMEGPEIVAEYRNAYHYASIRPLFVAYTADHTAEAASVGLAVGFTAVLRKGDGLRALIPFVARAAERKKQGGNPTSTSSQTGPRRGWTWREVASPELYEKHLMSIEQSLTEIETEIQCKRVEELIALLHRLRGQSFLFSTPIGELLAQFSRVVRRGHWEEIGEAWLADKRQIREFLVSSRLSS